MINKFLTVEKADDGKFHLFEEKSDGRKLKGVYNERTCGLFHIQVGDKDWEPTVKDIDEVVKIFSQAWKDPKGAVIATRKGVTCNWISFKQ